MQQLLSIQALRALAAAMVVFYHAQNDAGLAAYSAGAAFQRLFALPWAAGVDLFFVVSGFVMVLSSEKLFGSPGASSQFLRRRIARIAPLYWIATLIFLAMAARGALAGKTPMPSIGEIVSSFAFFPWPRALDGAPRPVHALGWTLEYEMFFYAVFACFVSLQRERAVAAVAFVLTTLVAYNTLAQPTAIAIEFWTDPIVLEFALGMAVALLYRRGLRLSGPAAFALALAAIVALAADPMDSRSEWFDAVTPNGFARLFSWGLPMAVAFAAATLGPAWKPTTATKALAAVGDASYALYLFHPLPIIVLRKLWLASGLAAEFGYWPLVIASSLASVALALLIYRFVEKPVTVFAQRRLTPASAPVTAARAIP